MYLYKSLGAATDDSDDLVCFNKDEAIGLITLYVEPARSYSSHKGQ